jgi:transcriptional regulator with XRE-family HTH domain
LPQVKTEARDEARALRFNGLSVREIERELGVSRSSVSRWVRGVVMPAEAAALLARRSGAGRLAAAQRKADAARDRRLAFQEEGRRRARVEPAEHVAGCMLYWAEGTKQRSSVEIANSEPELLRVFADFLRRFFAVPSGDIYLRCNLFADHASRQAEVERFWLDALGLPPSSLRTSMVNVASSASKGKRTNMLPYGTASLRVHSTRIVQTIYGSIQELGGFTRPAWLD